MSMREFERSGQLGPRFPKAVLLAGAKVAMIPCKIKGEPALKADAKVKGRNVVEYKTPEGYRIIRYHNTDIMRFVGNSINHIVIDTNWFRTKTTKDKLNQFLPPMLSVYQTKGEWTLNCRPHSRRKGWSVPFYDGITIIDLKKPKPDPAGLAEIARQKMLRKKIDKFVKFVGDKWPKGEVGYVKEDGSNAVLQLPGAGDCLVCRGIFPGRAPDCLESHMDENYVHGSLVANALRWANHTPTQIGIVWNMKDRVTQALRRYLKAQLGLVR